MQSLKRACILIFGLYAFVLVNGTVAYGASQFSIFEQYDPNNSIISIDYVVNAPHGGDSVRVSWTQGAIDYVEIASYTDTTFSTSITEKSFPNSLNNYAQHFTCNSPYSGDFYKNGELVFSIKMEVTGLVSPTCASNGEGDTEDPAPSPISDCGCMDDLEDIMIQMLTATTANGSSLQSIVDQITPTVILPAPIMPTPPTMEDNKPPMPTESFKDDTTYFSDAGEAPSPSALPLAPEPETCWKDLNGVLVCSDDALMVYPELEKDFELVLDDVLIPSEPLDIEQELIPSVVPSLSEVFDREPELSSDAVPSPSNELIKDNQFSSDAVPSLSEELTKDQFSSDAVPSLSNEVIKAPELEVAPVPQQMPINSELPNWTQ